MDINPEQIAFLTPFVLVITIAWGRWRRVSWARIGARCLLALSLLGIASATLTPFSLTVEHWRLFGMSQAQLVPLDTIRSMLAYGVVDSEFRQLAGNIVLFVPFGLALPLAVPRCRRVARTVAVGVLLSLAIELVQHVAPHHGFDIDDILLNGLGTAIGYLVYASLVRIARCAIHEHE